MGRGDKAEAYYDALCPYYQNDKIEIRQAEPYSYCQFIMGKDHSAYGRARHPFMTGSGGWAYFLATRYMLGIRPGFDKLLIDPCISGDWDGFEATRVWRGSSYRIKVENPKHVTTGVAQVVVDGVEMPPVMEGAGLAEKRLAAGLPCFADGKTHSVRIVMGEREAQL